MGTVGPCSSSLGRNGDMDLLLEAFGSAFSLEAITSAYSQAKHNVDLAGVILYESQGHTSAETCAYKDEKYPASKSSSEMSTEDAPQFPDTADGNVRGLVPSNILPGFLEGEHERQLSANGSSRTQADLDSNGSLSVSTGKDSGSMPGDMEEFLFKMLGDGFQLDMKVIHQVLGQCGYDLEKSMDTLVDLSASSLGKRDDVVSTTARSSQEKHLKIGSSLNRDKSQLSNLSLRSLKSRKKSTDKYDLEREVMGALFTAPERIEEPPKKTIPRSGSWRPGAFGRPVVEPLKDTIIEQTFVDVKPLGGLNEDKEDESSFQALRQAVKEYWAIMKEYYKSAVEAYTKGDQVRAAKLMKEGQFYNKKAREADETSAQKLLETREDEMLIDLSTHELKEALKLLKLHLSSLAGIATIPYLKATVGLGNDGGESRLKRLVVKLLERESIKWTEADEGKTIVIKLDEINPKTLSFSKKQC